MSFAVPRKFPQKDKLDCRPRKFPQKDRFFRAEARGAYQQRGNRCWDVIRNFFCSAGGDLRRNKAKKASFVSDCSVAGPITPSHTPPPHHTIPHATPSSCVGLSIFLRSKHPPYSVHPPEVQTPAQVLPSPSRPTLSSSLPDPSMLLVEKPSHTLQW